MKKRFITGVLLALLSFISPALASPEKLEPIYPSPEYVNLLIDIANEELGYTEKNDGSTKYGAWYGDAKAEWCAEFLCWCVNEVDNRHGTNLLKEKYPLYGATNIGLNWFLQKGRYVSRTGSVNGWGSQWYIESQENIGLNEYIPQPGDWAFFSYTPSGDTTHVAMVEQVVKRDDGIYIQVFEGNNPDKVQKALYSISDWRILGYGTVFDIADIAMRKGNEGDKVRTLQNKLVALNLLANNNVSGVFDASTENSIKHFQMDNQLSTTGIADKETQLLLNAKFKTDMNEENTFWIVEGGL
jgi:hypothetical protein